MKKNWLEETLDNSFAELANQKKNESWFSLSAISNVPYIEYPGFSKEECKEVQEQTKNVLRISRNENNYQEVAITYKKDSNVKEKEYFKVLGDYSSVLIMDDEDTRNLLHLSNEKNDLVVISIHNHPNNSRFSINDLLVFTENPSIKLMEIVNGKGEISFLLRPREIDLHNLISSNIIDFVPDFIDRKFTWKLQNQNKSFKISDLINLDERKQIVKESLLELQQRGCIYCDYISNETISKVIFDAKSDSYEYNSDKLSVTKIPNLLSSSDDEKYEYLENGEDGYEWE